MVNQDLFFFKKINNQKIIGLGNTIDDGWLIPSNYKELILDFFISYNIMASQSLLSLIISEKSTIHEIMNLNNITTIYNQSILNYGQTWTPIDNSFIWKKIFIPPQFSNQYLYIINDMVDTSEITIKCCGYIE